MDGVTKEQYGQDLERNLRDLHERMKAKWYRHQPIRRVHIPKEGGKTRPIGISAFEDKGPKPSKGSSQLVAVSRLAWNAWTLGERGATAPQPKIPTRFRPDIECVF